MRKSKVPMPSTSDRDPGSKGGAERLPIRAAFPSREAWLDAYVRHAWETCKHTWKGGASKESTGPWLILGGSIGVWAYMFPDGRVWLEDDDWGWFEALGTLRVLWIMWYIDFGDHPELRCILPTRQPGAPFCADCDGTGNAHHPKRPRWPCRWCGGLGFFPEGSFTPADLRRPTNVSPSPPKYA